MWKTVCVPLLRCGAIYGIFGVFGVMFYVVKWSAVARRHPQPCTDEPQTP